MCIGHCEEIQKLTFQALALLWICSDKGVMLPLKFQLTEILIKVTLETASCLINQFKEWSSLSLICE